MPPEVKACDQYPGCKDEDRKNIEFRATVLTTLKSIDDSIRELKSDKKDDDTDLWSAIVDLRKIADKKMDKQDVYAAIAATGTIVGVVGLIVQVLIK